MSPLHHAEQVFSALRKKTNKVILFYSCGKDSIALLFLCRKFFEAKNIVCVYMEFVEGLTHTDNLLNFAEKENTLIKLPHWQTSHYIANNYYRIYKPVKCEKIMLTDVYRYVRSKTGIDWIIDGKKMSDSMNRRLQLMNLEMKAIDAKNKTASPLSLWNKNDVLSFMKFNKLPKPFAYSGKTSNGLDLNKPCLSFLKNNYPDDYQKILEIFPLAESILWQ